jgi:GT2 family glycosyltransferase
MINKILRTRITVIIPTMNRKKLFSRFMKSIMKNCKLKIDFIIVNSNSDKSSAIENINIRNQDSIFEIFEIPSTVGKARNLGFNKAIELKNEYIFTGDDDCVIGNDSIEKMLAIIIQDKKIGSVGHLGNYKCFARNFKKNEIRFWTVFGVFWLTRKSIINKIGNIDETMKAREDDEFHHRIWNNNYYCVICDADIKHNRHQPLECGERTICENYSEEWIKCCDIIADRYPKIVKSKSGKLYRQFKFPNIKYSIDENFILTKENINE